MYKQVKEVTNSYSIFKSVYVSSLMVQINLFFIAFSELRTLGGALLLSPVRLSELSPLSVILFPVGSHSRKTVRFTKMKVFCQINGLTTPFH